ncbi:hypothetical protein GCM10018790_78200 [Kitasatospora xanthocidica]|uniref:hypothetical protein n=1 Tax=Kitasatospora xanthocidica TaxID=83382 RepID=UPI001671D3F4|nr:hypothetical protein [Kitasatospora xanthocidica]GHF89177.1 hypothetical protein GCM10018790_78200 [Kitasatospora xanthocidica]
MDPELATLAQSASLTLVTLMATDAWERARDGVVALWRQAVPERADAVAAELENTREDLASDPATEDELAAEWQGRIRRLLAGHPEVAVPLRSLLDELAPDAAPAPTAPAVSQHASASGESRIYQAGRDLRVTER